MEAIFPRLPLYVIDAQMCITQPWSLEERPLYLVRGTDSANLGDVSTIRRLHFFRLFTIRLADVTVEFFPEKRKHSH